MIKVLDAIGIMLGMIVMWLIGFSAGEAFGYKLAKDRYSEIEEGK